MIPTSPNSPHLYIPPPSPPLLVCVCLITLQDCIVPSANQPPLQSQQLVARKKKKMRMQVVEAASSGVVVAGGGGGVTSSAAAAEEAAMMGVYERVARMASGNAVVVFSYSGCCMCHVVKRLLLGLGVGPTVYELDDVDHQLGGDIHAALSQLLPPGQAPVPVVFVGGRLLGGVEKVMACHINGTLVPLLKQAGALWL